MDLEWKSQIAFVGVTIRIRFDRDETVKSAQGGVADDGDRESIVEWKTGVLVAE